MSHQIPVGAEPSRGTVSIGSVMTATTAHNSVIPRNCKLHEGSHQAVSCVRGTTRFTVDARNDIQGTTRSNRAEPDVSTNDSRLPTPDFAT
jgi:hypothetical protein